MLKSIQLTTKYHIYRRGGVWLVTIRKRKAGGENGYHWMKLRGPFFANVSLEEVWKAIEVDKAERTRHIIARSAQIGKTQTC